MSSSEIERSPLSDDEEQKSVDLDASDTDSDDDDNQHEYSDSGEDNIEEAIKTKSLKEKITEQLNKKYSDRHGKQLHIRFPHKLPEKEADFQNKVKALSSLIVKAHKPRQKHARFCLVDFQSREDRNIALHAIKSSTKSGDSKIVASIPRTESTEFINELVERKVNALEKKRAKVRLRKASKLALRDKNFTSTIVISNLPQSATVSEVRKLFPTAVDVHIKPRKSRLVLSSIAAITLPTTMEARAAIKKEYSLGGEKLILNFDTRQRKRFRNASKNGQRTVKSDNKESKMKKKKVNKKYIMNKKKIIEKY